MSLFETHEAGLDVLGSVGIGDFVPWLGLVGKIAGGVGGDSGGSSPEAQKAAIAKAIAEQKQREALAKAQADASRTKLILFGTLGVLGVGGLVFALARRKK